MNILYELAWFSQILTKEPDNMSGLKCRTQLQDMKQENLINYFNMTNFKKRK